MSLSAATALTQVRQNLNEETAAFWTDVEIGNWIEEGTKATASKTLLVEDNQIINPMIQDQLMYSDSDETWLADVIELYAVVYNDGGTVYKGLIKIHPRQLGNVATFSSGAPKYYCLFNRELYVWPMSTAAIAAAGQLMVLFSKETSDIADLKDEFQHLPVIYATAKAKQKDRAFGEANTLLSQFYNEVNFERGDKHTRETDSTDKFKIPTRGGGQGAQG